jgi:hypothetical protein
MKSNQNIEKLKKAISDKNELPFENNGTSLLSPLLSLIAAPT